MRKRFIAAVGFACSASPSSASAELEFAEPADGAVVSSRPVFVVTGGGRPGSVNGEVARDPTMLTAGDRVGAFVEPVDSFIEFFGDEADLPEDSVRWNSSQLLAGSYFWHGQIDMYDGGEEQWSPVRTFTVRDEPVVLKGWSSRVTEAHRTHRCATRKRVAGKLDYDDNDPRPSGWVVRVMVGAKRIARFAGRGGVGDARISGVFCTRATTFDVAVTITDKGGHRADARRSVSVSRR